MIKYIDESDKEHPEVHWGVYGDVKTNEIVVIATLEGKKYEKREKSPILHPAMIDRIFGIDIADGDVAARLSNEIYDESLQTHLENNK
jgi:hypothetical protein